jgi:hypothetical protein
MAMTTKEVQPKNVSNNYLSLKEFAQSLCDEPKDNVEGILILCPKKEDNPIYLEVCTKKEFHDIATDGLGGSILKVLKYSNNLVISDHFHPGDIKSIIYEFDNLIFVVYHLKADKLDDVYLVLVNTMDKDLGSFNANRGRVRAQMVVAIKRSGQLSDMMSI